MDSPVSNPLLIPRLRLSRHPPSTLHDQEPHSLAGPSRPYNVSRLSPVDDLSLIDSEDGENEGATTPIVSSKTAVHEPFSRVSDPSPARSRLKEVLAEFPQENSNSTPVPRPYLRQTSSETESEAEARNGYSHTSTAARAGLRRLLHDAQRETDDAYSTTKRRRNSFDLSETEVKPQLDIRKARRSLSDEEAEYSHGFRQAGSSSSKAESFNRLRQQLNATQLKDEPTLDYIMGNDSYDTAAVLRDLANKITQPVATSTPPQSFRISAADSHLQLQSNLLEQDSEMQRAIADLDSYDAGNATTHRSLSFPPPRKSHLADTRSTSPGLTNNSAKADSWERIHRSTEISRQQSWEAKRSISRAGSSHSSLDHQPTNSDADLLREREREWNKHRTPARATTPDPKHHAHTLSRSSSPAPGGTNSRRNSTVSLRSETSLDSSFLSQSDHEDRLKVAEREHTHELEFGWNKPRGRSGKQLPNTSLNVTERQRTYSHPSRPGSSQAFLSPDQPVRSRRLSTSSPRASSPARSHDGDDTDSEPEVQHEIEYERERNWNAPHPKWGPHEHPSSRSTSPIPPSPRLKLVDTPNGEPRQDSLHPQDLKSSLSLRSTSPIPRLRKQVTPVSPSRPISYPSHPASPSHSRSKSSIAPGSQRPLSYPARPASPLPPLKLVNGNKSSPSNGLKRTPSKRDESPEQSLSKGFQKNGPLSPSTSRILRTPSRLDVTKPSQISVKTPKKHTDGDGRGRSDSTSTSQSINNPTPPVYLKSRAPVDESTTSKDTLPLRFPDAGSSDELQLLSPNVLYESAQGQHDILPLSPEVSITILSPLPSPPIDSPPSSPLLLPSVLRTPQRQSSSGNSHQFQTPPPPRDLPDLPDPPSAEEDDSDPMNSLLGRTAAPSLRMDLSSLKTPKPPGAWTATPAPRARVAEPQDPPEQTVDADIRSFHSGLITPAASISKGSHLPAQTPAPPGAWQATPALRKSILKVRFDNVDMSTSEASKAVDVDQHPSNFLENGEESVDAEPHYILNPVLKNGGETQPSNGGSTTPTTSPPAKRPLEETMAPISPSRKSSIRVVNAYGKEHPIQSSPKRNKSVSSNGSFGRSSLRIVDAMGHELNVENDEPEQDSGVHQVALSHNEALVRVRQGLSDLAQDLDDLDRTIEEPMDKARYDQLQNVSKQARTSWTQLKQAVQAKDRKMRSQLTVMNGNQIKPTTQERIAPLLALKPWMFCVALVLQLLIVVFMYRWSIQRSRQFYLTQFYDPLNPDMYLHVPRSDIQTALPPIPWLSIPQILWNEGWSAFGAQLGRQFSALLESSLWGPTDNYTLSAGIPWPPT